MYPCISTPGSPACDRTAFDDENDHEEQLASSTSTVYLDPIDAEGNQATIRLTRIEHASSSIDDLEDNLSAIIDAISNDVSNVLASGL
jgi:hypothetical protein